MTRERWAGVQPKSPHKAETLKVRLADDSAGQCKLALGAMADESYLDYN